MTVRLARNCMIALAVVAVATILSESSAKAQWGGFPGYGYGYNIYTSERVPFYAISPPVYYKHPVPRPYGYSPFAYPPGVLTPPATTAPPEIVVNNYVRVPSQPAPTSSAMPKPEIILNPFVKQE